MAAVFGTAWRSKVTFSYTDRPGSGVTLQPISGSSSNTATTSISGTTLSTTTYTATSSSDSIILSEYELRTGSTKKLMRLTQELVERRQHLWEIVEEFCSGSNGKVTAPDRWLSELNVAWLIHLAELDASARGIFISQQQLQHLVQTWILALREITTYICKEEATVESHAAPEFVRFFETILLKMLIFVDVITAPLNVNDPSCQHRIVCTNKLGSTQKLRALLDVHHALSRASTEIMMSFSLWPALSTRITDDMEGLLSAELGKLDKAVYHTEHHIWTAVMSSLNHIWTAVMSSLNDDSLWGISMTLQPSPDIHKVTRSIINYINVLLPANCANHHRAEDRIFVTSIIMEMVASLEKKLTTVSESFPDESIRFLFLINNTYFIGQQLQLNHDLTYKIDKYIESYLQVSWAPVLEYLNRPKFNCFTTSPPLPKFECKFLTIYAAQKFWKVPDPDLRKRLREVIIEKVVSGFAKYLEDNNRITPRITPRQVAEMLQELFEG